MIKTYEIDLDDKLVNEASEVFEMLGSDIDSAIKIFLTQAILRNGFPFEVALPQNGGSETEKENLLEESELASISENKGAETEKKDLSKEFGEKSNSEDNIAAEKFGEAEKLPADSCVPENSAEPDSYKIAALKKDIEELSSKTDISENSPVENENSPSENETPDSEDEDETAPENLFSQWDCKK